MTSGRARRHRARHQQRRGDREQPGHRGDEERRRVGRLGREPGAVDQVAGEDRRGDRRAERAPGGAHHRVDARRDSDLVLRHRPDDQVRDRGEGERDAGAQQDVRRDDLPRVRVRGDQHEEGARGQRGAGRQQRPPAQARAQPPGDRARRELCERRRHHQQPGLGHGRVEAVAGPVGRLRELRHEQERAEHRQADDERRQVRGGDRAVAQQRDVDQRVAHAQLDRRERAEQQQATDDGAEVAGRAPAPQVRLRDAEQDRGERQRQHGRAEPVDPRPARRRRGRRDEDMRGDRRRRREQADPEQPRQRHVVDDDPESGSPIPPPIPNTALMIDSPPGTRSRGNVSRITPKASGNTPPATPWSARPAIRTAIESASALTTPPAANSASTIVSTRPLP